MGGNVVIKSGLWYTVSNFLSKGILFLATPLFTRLLTQEEFGAFSVFSSWLSIFIIVVTLNVETSLIVARYDYEDSLDSYVFSMYTLSALSTAVWAILINIFMTPVSNLLGLKPSHINLMLLYLLFFPALSLYQTQERFMFRYKTSSALSLLSSVGATVAAAILVWRMDENKLDGRIIGHVLPTAVVGAALVILIWVKGKRVVLSTWKYALKMCLPYIPHLLSMMVLTSTDRIMIEKLCGETGAQDAAIYSVAYNVAMIVTLLMNALNGAFSPWLASKLAKQEFHEIRKGSKLYIGLFLLFSLGIMLLSPEVLEIMGGAQYRSAKSIMIPIMLGCMCQFLYTLFVNIEQFYKKTVGMAFASVSAALLNVVLNLWLIPIFGYEAAAYTTLVGYLWLLIIHMLLVKRLDGQKIYSYRFVFAALGVISLLSVGVLCLFLSNLVRRIVTAIYAAAIVAAAWKFRDKILKLLKK